MDQLQKSRKEKMSSKLDKHWQAPLKLGLVAIAIGALSACATVEPGWHESSQQHAETLSSSSTPNTQANATNESEADERFQRMAKIYSGQAFGRAKAAKASKPRKAEPKQFRPQGGDIVLNFSDVPVQDAAQMILGDQLGKEFSVDPAIKGKVSLNNTEGLASADLVPTLEALLSSVDARLEVKDNNYVIVPGAQNRLAISQGNLEIIPLRYIDANEFAKLLSNYQVATSPIKRGNLLAVSGTSDRIKKVRELAKSFDINWLKGMSIGIFPVENTSAATLRDELMDLFGNQIDNDAAQALRIVAVERSNSLMVIANQTDYVKLMGQWVERLDKSGGESNQSFFVYHVQNGRASDLAKLLDSMFSSSPDRSNQANRDGSSTAPRALSNLNKRDSFRVVADDSTNSIIITGSPHYYKAVSDAMKQLDNTPLQVLIEARIMELTLNDDLQYGLEWFLNGSSGNSTTRGGLDLGAAGIGAIQPGFSYVVERAGEVRAALNGLADDSRLKVLSSPSLMVLNNRTASIRVGDEVPIPTRQAVSNISPDAPTVNEIEYRNTGILLTVSPRVNSSGMVTMDISQEVSSVVNNTSSQIDAPTIQQRQLNSTVSIRDGQTVVLGGLIRDQDSTRDAGVPLLKDIPGVGKLFSTTDTRSKRTELVVLITPRVISNEKDTDAITKEYQQKMLGLQPINLDEF